MLLTCASPSRVDCIRLRSVRVPCRACSPRCCDAAQPSQSAAAWPLCRLDDVSQVAAALHGPSSCQVYSCRALCSSSSSPCVQPCSRPSGSPFRRSPLLGRAACAAARRVPLRRFTAETPSMVAMRSCRRVVAASFRCAACSSCRCCSSRRFVVSVAASPLVVRSEQRAARA